MKVDECKLSPESKYDPFINKQSCINENLMTQVKDAREKLANLTHSLKNIQVCGKGKILGNVINLSISFTHMFVKNRMQPEHQGLDVEL